MYEDTVWESSRELLFVGPRAATVVFVETYDKSQDRTHTHPRAMAAVRSWSSHTQWTRSWQISNEWQGDLTKEHSHCVNEKSVVTVPREVDPREG